MKNQVNVDEWVAMFEEVGLDEAMRMQWHKLFAGGHQLWVEMLEATGMDDAAKKRWHVEFERPAQDGHQEFFLSLGIPLGEVERIRSWSRGEIEDYELPDGEEWSRTGSS